MRGKVYLVGAGPGDPELLTRKAWRVLQSADVVLHDDLVSREILAVLPATARILNVGKRCGARKISQAEINQQMVGYALAGRIVARLKSGDPLLFGRAGEEMDALRQAGIEFEIIPGVTAALGAAASARIPLTDRRHASRVVFVTAHRARAADPAANDPDKHVDEHFGQRFDDLGVTPEVIADTTYVIYMPGNRYSELSEELKSSGIGAEVPCLVISRATTREETSYRTTVGELSRGPVAPSPSLLIVGAMVGAMVEPVATASDGKISAMLDPEILSLAMQHPFHDP